MLCYLLIFKVQYSNERYLLQINNTIITFKLYVGVPFPDY